MASQAGYNTLNIASGVTAQLVAIATEKCNSKSGYTVTLTTANAPTGTSAFLKGTRRQYRHGTLHYDVWRCRCNTDLRQRSGHNGQRQDTLGRRDQRT